MKFPYKKYGSGIVRPVIPIEVSYGNQSQSYEVLVDSGADMCIFSAQIGELIGIDIKRGKPFGVAGITGSVEEYYVYPVTITVGGWPYRIEVGFLPNLGRLGYGVVGQRGFFDLFTVKFDYQKGGIELNPKS